ARSPRRAPGPPRASGSTPRPPSPSGGTNRSGPARRGRWGGECGAKGGTPPRACPPASLDREVEPRTGGLAPARNCRGPRRIVEGLLDLDGAELRDIARLRLREPAATDEDVVLHR